MTAPDGAVTGELVVARRDSGRRVRFESDDLEILPTGEFYEVWFVGPGDSLPRPTGSQPARSTPHPAASAM